MADKETLKINRLVLVGNGFDLSLGLNTSYGDFIFWLKKKLITEAFENPRSIELGFHQGYLDNKLYNIKILNIHKSTWLDFLHKESNYTPKKQKENFQWLLNSRNRDIKILAKGNFISQIDRDFELGWVNIEDVFYQNLKKAKGDRLTVLNEQLSELKVYLTEYLLQEQTNLTKGGNFFSPYRSRIVSKDIDQLELNSDFDIKNKELELGSIQFVNFNYTDTVEKLKSTFATDEKKRTNPIISIHGSLDDSMIFGYGDEEDDDYPILEKLGDNKYLEHVKSFRYLQDSNYYDLMRFINSGPYQILIYGHSCGLSDRTMLKELFENENCLSIKPYYYKRSDEVRDDDYFDKVMEISRHFTDNGLMRKKVVSFDKCSPMPQPS